MLFGKTCLPGVEHALPSCSQDVDIGSQHASDATTAVSALGSGAISTHTVRRFELRRKRDRRHWGETDPSDPARSDSEDHHDDESDGLHATLCQNGLESQKSSHAKMRKRRKHPLYQFRNGYQSSSVGKPSHQMLQKRKRGKGIETSSLMFMQQGWRVLFRICRKFSFFGSFLGGFEPSVFATLTVLHSLSFTSTSFIEEENHTWYFFVATLWFVYLRSTISCTTWGKDRGNDHRGDLRDPFVIISGVSADGSEGEEGSHGKSDDGLQFNLGDRITKLRGTGSASSASYRAKCQIEIQMGAQTTDDNALGMNQTVSDRSDRLPLSILLAAVMAGLVASRILRGWHRGGVNFANQPDIAKLLEKDIDAKQVCTMIRGVVIGVVTLIMCVAVFFRFPQQEEDKRHHPKQVSGSRRLIDRAWDRARTGVFVVGVAAAGGTIWVYHAMDKRLAVIGNGTSLGSGKGSPPLLVGPIEFNVEPGTVAGATYALLAVLMGLAFFDASWSCRREGGREAHECSDYVRDAKGLTSTALGNTKSKNLMAFNLRNLQENNRYAAERLSVGCAAACGSCGGPGEKTEIMLTSGDSGESFSEGKGNENYEMPTNSDHTSTRQTDAAVAVTVARASLRGLERIGWVCMGITCLIQLLLQTETNAGVVLLMLLQLLAYLQYVENDSCRRRREWEIVLALEWLGTAGFFSTGNTNTLATINMSGAFTGLSPQNYVGAAILMFITTYGAPLLSVGPTMIALSRLGRRDVPSLSSTGFSSPNNSKASTCSRYQAWSQLPQRLCNITAVACIVPLAFHAIALATFTLVLFIHRGHPFIWIVFCPK
ncbi:hypothetical protein CBR_g48853 [Chara braunii]|uniref:GPI ethanolamine phosphate transferase 2 C-terminal domain-containing protein n=1 Tax=Chara braunii TaxID=69332 RepID=A0A388M3N0_CHABU|nr:hypothetical protein CBR_g48853 [Chara braunii]|eukprot:GBG89146.1 hypothetical protein CBR_g48853 [Chara braunii]